MSIQHFQTLKTIEENTALDLLLNVATAIDTQIGSQIAALQMLAVSPFVDDPSNLKGLYHEAQGFRQNFHGHVILADLSMQMLFNTRVPFGTTLPKLPRPKGHAAAPTVLKTGQPSVGDMFLGPIAKEPLTAVVVPVIRSGQTRFLLISIIETRQFQKRLDEVALPSGWSLTVFDGKNEMMASRWSPEMNQHRGHEKFSKRRLIKLTLSPWSVTIDIPHKTYSRRVLAESVAYVSAILVITFISVMLGRLSSRRLAGLLAGLVETPSIPAANQPAIAEIESVRQLLNKTVIKWQKSKSAMSKSEEQLRLSTELANVAVWEYDFISNSMSRSKNHDQLYGLEWQTNWDINTFINSTHPDDRERTTAIIQKSVAVKGPDQYTFDFRVVHPDQSIHWLMVTGQVVERNLEGQGLLVRGCLIDITERKQAEESLLENTKIFKHVFESANVGKSITDPSGEITVNNAFAEMLGYSREELSNRTWQELTPPDEIETIQKRLTPLLNGEKYSARFTKRYVHKSGSHIWADVSAVILRDNDGQPLRFITTIVDITERNRIEKQLANTLSYVQTIIENSAIGIATLKANGQIVTANASLAKIVGGTIEKIVTQNIHNLESWRTSGMLAAAEEALGNGIEKNLVFHYISSFNKECWTSCLFIPFTHEGEQQLLLMLTDILESKRAEAKHEKVKAQLQQAQKMESVGRLAGGVAHDYNNALSVIMGFTELALDEVEPTSSLRSDLDQILLAANRAAGITRQLLAFARKQTIAPKVLDLNHNVKEMLKMLQRLIGEDITLGWLPGAELWAIKMDPSQLDQILANLCVNARDAIIGVGRITIETGKVEFDNAYCLDHPGFAPGEFVMLAVSDDGCGMDKELLDTIFEPFFTTKESDKGTGLGLSTVYGIVKQNKGFINVYSEPGIGTTIKIYLPRSEGNVVEPQRKSTEKLPQGHGEMILVVEDDSSILKLVMQMLTGEGYRVLTANTPKQAIRLAEEQAGGIHLLVTDVIMPEMNGLELTNRLQSLCPGLKCIFMSGYTAETIAHHGVLDEGVHFVQKPFSKRELVKIIRKVLNEAKGTT